MKKLFTAVFATLTLAFSLTSCLKDEKDEFAITGGVSYVMQECAQDGSYTFVPYFTIFSSSMGHKIAEVKMTSAEKSLAMVKLSDYQWCTDNTKNIFTNPSDISATYTVTAIDANNERVVETLKASFDEKDILGEMKVETMYYKDNVITAITDIPTNAVAIGYSLTFFNEEESEYNRIFSYVVTDSYDFTGTLIPLKDQAKDGKVTAQLRFDTDSQQDMMYFQKVNVGVVAVSPHGIHRVYNSKILYTKAQAF